jgi:hypothetical protein
MNIECEKAREFMRDKFFEELPKEDCEILAAHIKTCEQCKKYNKELLSVETMTNLYKDQYQLFCKFIGRQSKDLKKGKIKIHQTPVLFLVAIIQKGQRREVYREEWLPCAAGVKKKIPPIQEILPEFFDGKKVVLTFKQSGDTLKIDIRKASAILLKKLDLIVVFQDGSKEFRYGKDIVGGGPWEIDTAGKTIISIELVREEK